MRSEDGTFNFTNRRVAPDIPEENYMPADKMLSTPGYEVNPFSTDSLPEAVLNREQDIILEVEYPYSMATLSFSECFSGNLTYYGGLFNQIFFLQLRTGCHHGISDSTADRRSQVAV